MSKEPQMIEEVQNPPTISVIIPTLNEEAAIDPLIRRLRDVETPIEIIVVDGNSTDNTRAVAQSLGAKVVLVESPSRPKQLNRGAKIAKSGLLYFVHADTLPPKNYDRFILSAVAKGAEFGCFRFKFMSAKRSLKLNSWFTRLPFMIFRGGDQSLFISRALFIELKGFKNDHIVMEDFDIIRRGKAFADFKVLPADIEVSDRKYQMNNYLKVNVANLIVFILFYLGVKPVKLLSIYKSIITHPKQ